MRKLDATVYQTLNERPISLAVAERQQAAEAARQAEIADPSVKKLLSELQSAAENSINTLKSAFSELTKRHNDIIELESALQIANKAIIELNGDRASKPDEMALKNTEARNDARAKADQLQVARDSEANALSSMPIPKTCVELERWRQGLQQAIASLARDEKRRNRKEGDVEFTEANLEESVARDPRVAELSKISRLHRNAKSSFEQTAEAIDLLTTKLDFLRANHENISRLIGHGFQARFCSWEWRQVWN
jgi:hypothetical protein